MVAIGSPEWFNTNAAAVVDRKSNYIVEKASNHHRDRHKAAGGHRLGYCQADDINTRIDGRALIHDIRLYSADKDLQRNIQGGGDAV